MTMKVVRKGAKRPWQDEHLGRNSGEMSAHLKKAGAEKKRVPFDYDKELPHLRTIAKLCSDFGKVFNRFESHGVENIPESGPALIVFYHALVPLDAWYFGMDFYLKSNRLIHALGDRWLFRIPGVKQLADAVGIVPACPENAKRLLGEGRLVAVAPGGVREAVAGTSQNYKLKWDNRKGFAELVHDAKVCVIPAFSENSEQMYVSPLSAHPIFQTLYERTRLPLVPIFGLGLLPLPVRITTWIGEPIYFLPSDSVEFISAQTQAAVEALIQKHQQKNKSVGEAILERLKDQR